MTDAVVWNGEIRMLVTEPDAHQSRERDIVAWQAGPFTFTAR
jgi:hypothetical protein